jgi:hypothetical protein
VLASGTKEGIPTRYELRTRKVSETLDATFKLYRDNLKPFLGLGAVLFVPSALFQAQLPLLKHLRVHHGFSDLALPGLALLVFVVGWIWIGGAMACATTDAYLGKSFTVAGSLRRAFSLSPALFWTGLLAFLGQGLGFALLVVPGIYLTLSWCVWSQAVVVEGQSGTDALARSDHLTAGARARVGWLMLLFGVIQYAFAIGVDIIVPAAGSIPWIGALIKAVPSALLTPLYSSLYTLIYFDGRIRREAWDLEVKAAEVLASAAPAGIPAAS